MHPDDLVYQLRPFSIRTRNAECTGRKNYKMPKHSNENPSSLEVDPNEHDLVCGACLMHLFSEDCKEIAVPSGCPHLFHWDCLNNWAQLQNTCPQCKNRFRVAGKYTASEREFLECVKFRKRNRLSEADEDEVEEDLPVDLCEKCREPGTEEELILCDGMDYTCNAMFHYKCVGFKKVPSGLWFCEHCLEKGYVPAELRAKSPPKKKARPASPPPPPIPAPRLFPRQLIVQQGATRKTSSSKVPANLVLDRAVVLPTHASSSESVFARFRERRLLKKQQENSLQ